MNYTTITHSADAKDVVKGFSCDAAAKAGVKITRQDLADMGFTVDSKIAENKEVMAQMAQDAGLSQGEANIDALVQFFTVINEKTINTLYRGRTAAAAFGVESAGDWTTERLVFKTRELVAPKPGLYDDHTRPSLTNYNYGWDYRNTVRFEFGVEVTKLEEAQGAIMHRNPMSDKKDALVLSDAIWQNEFFWNGVVFGTGSLDDREKHTTYKIADKRLFGFFNDPSLPSGVNATTDFRSVSITTAQVIKQLQTWKQLLTDQLQGNGDIDTLPIKMLLPLKAQQAFVIPNDFAYTAKKWLEDNWKNLTIQYCPEFDDQCVIFVENVPDVGMKTVSLISTSKLRLVGAMPSLKGREEAYSSSIAGAFIAAPMAILNYYFG